MINKLFLLIYLILLNSCSAAMAMKKVGPCPEQLENMKQRQEILPVVDEVLFKESTCGGGEVEMYLVSYVPGSAKRALAHSVLNFSTFGLWEWVALPLEKRFEKNVSHKEQFILKVGYDENERVLFVERQ